MDGWPPEAFDRAATLRERGERLARDTAQASDRAAGETGASPPRSRSADWLLWPLALWQMTGTMDVRGNVTGRWPN